MYIIYIIYVQMRASNQAAKADHARSRELAATNAMITRHCNHGNFCQCSHHGNIRPHHHGNIYSGPPAGQVTVTYQPPPMPGVNTITVGASNDLC